MVAASYHCRNRNNAAEGKLSEHALANAIDLRAFVAGQSTLEVADGWRNPTAKPPVPPTAGAPPPGRIASIGPPPAASTLADAATAQDAFLRAIHQGACGPFTTVLGPDADAAHLDHLHLDLVRRRSGASYCR